MTSKLGVTQTLRNRRVQSEVVAEKAKKMIGGRLNKKKKREANPLSLRRSLTRNEMIQKAELNETRTPTWLVQIERGILACLPEESNNREKEREGAHASNEVMKKSSEPREEAVTHLVVGVGELDLAVNTARSQQGGIQDINSVGGHQDLLESIMQTHKYAQMSVALLVEQSGVSREANGRRQKQNGRRPVVHHENHKNNDRWIAIMVRATRCSDLRQNMRA